MSAFQRLILTVVLALLAVEAAVALTQDNDSPQVDDRSKKEVEEPDDRRVKRLGDVDTEEWELDLNIPAAPTKKSTPKTSPNLPDSEQNERLQSILSDLAARPGNRKALDQLNNLLDEVILQSRALADQGDTGQSRELLGIVQSINPKKQGLDQAFRYLDDLDKVDDWLTSGAAALASGRIIEPARGSALFHFENVLSVAPENAEAKSGLLHVQRALTDRALDSALDLDFESAEEWLFEASQIREPQELVEAARLEIEGYLQNQVERLVQDVQQAIAQGNFDYAEFVLIDLIALSGNSQKVIRLREELGNARIYGQYSPGQVIQDEIEGINARAPAVVVIKPGSFMMGSPEDEDGRAENEGPQHRVTLAQGFAIGLQEVTVGQFRHFMENARYRTEAEKKGQSRVYEESSGRITMRDGINWVHDYTGERATENSPVLHISWNDVKAYVDWLSRSTGKRYRLPTEAEFEYALRAGTATRFWWGDDRPEQALENLTGTEDSSENGRVWTNGFRRYKDGYWGPAPGAIYPPNPWGLHDMAGNVSEWVEDCWHQTYARAPIDGSAWVNPGCSRKVIRGGYWASAPDQSRSASRLSGSAGLHGPRVGFRIARDL